MAITSVHLLSIYYVLVTVLRAVDIAVNKTDKISDFLVTSPVGEVDDKLRGECDHLQFPES